MRTILTLLLLLLGVEYPTWGADAVNGGPRSKMEIRIRPTVVREFILKSITADPELSNFFDEQSLRDSLPPFYEAHYPTEWPNWREIGFGIRLPFLKLGDWRLVFGAREMLNDQGAKHDHRVLQYVSLVRKRYFVDGLPNEIECTEINLYVRSSGNLDSWSDGNIVELELESWEVLSYRVTNRGTYSRGSDAHCLAAGGSLRDQAGKVLKTTITHEAFIGHVERVVDIP